MSEHPNGWRLASTTTGVHTHLARLYEDGRVATICRGDDVVPRRKTPARLTCRSCYYVLLGMEAFVRRNLAEYKAWFAEDNRRRYGHRSEGAASAAEAPGAVHHEAVPK